jgi:hypothetical protein
MKHISNAEFGGQCAFAVSLGKKDVIGNGKHYIVKDNKNIYSQTLLQNFYGM